MSATLQASGNQLLQPNLSIFHAVAVGTAGNNLVLTTTSSELTVFTQVNINRGNDYNASTCRYTAPVTGIYEFEMFFISGNANDVFRFDFAKNGSAVSFQPQLRLDTLSANTDFEIGSAGMFVELAANDYISIFGASGSGNNAFIDTAGTYSYFRGRFVA